MNLTASFKRLMNRDITALNNKDVGLIITLVFLICFLKFDRDLFITLAVASALITTLAPALLRPVSHLWFGLSELMGTIMSRILLITVFFIIITPIGMIRRLLTGARLQAEQWKKGTGSVFTVRDKTFSAEDISNPY